MEEVAVRYLHFAAILTLVAAVLGQHQRLRPLLTRAEIGAIQKLDVVYAVSTVVVLVTGFIQWFGVGKPAQFYSGNGIFHAKVTLFLIVGVLSILPSVFLSRQRKGDPGESVLVPASVRWMIRAELAILFFIPLLAILMARGIGLGAG